MILFVNVITVLGVAVGVGGGHLPVERNQKRESLLVFSWE